MSIFKHSGKLYRKEVKLRVGRWNSLPLQGSKRVSHRAHALKASWKLFGMTRLRLLSKCKSQTAFGPGWTLRSTQNGTGKTVDRAQKLVQTQDQTWAAWGPMRGFATDTASSASGDSSKKAGGGASKGYGGVTEAYRAAWKKAAPRIDIHKTPSDFMKPRPAPTAAGALPAKLTLNFVLPHKTILHAKEVDMVIVPATTGMMGVLAGHVPTISMLSAGLLSIHDGAEVKNYFVSSGFAIVNPNSVTDVLALEAEELANLDIEAARKGLADYTQKQSSSTTELDKAEAQIAIEVYGAIVGTMTTAT